VTAVATTMATSALGMRRALAGSFGHNNKNGDDQPANDHFVQFVDGGPRLAMPLMFFRGPELRDAPPPIRDVNLLAEQW